MCVGGNIQVYLFLSPWGFEAVRYQRTERQRGGLAQTSCVVDDAWSGGGGGGDYLGLYDGIGCVHGLIMFLLNAKDVDKRCGSFLGSSYELWRQGF